MTTLTQLIATYNELAQAAGKPTRKGFDNKAKASAAIAELTPKKTRRSGASIKVMAATKTTGPRGFKFGPVWTGAVRTASGIALRAGNFTKLLQHAGMLGVKTSDEMTQEEVAKACSAKLA